MHFLVMHTDLLIHKFINCMESFSKMSNLVLMFQHYQCTYYKIVLNGYSYVWLSMVIYDYVVMHGYAWLYGYLWYVWLCMVCMVIYDDGATHQRVKAPQGLHTRGNLLLATFVVTLIL